MLKIRVLSIFLLVLLAACIPLTPLEEESTPEATLPGTQETEPADQPVKPTATPGISANELVIWLPAQFAAEDSSGWGVLSGYLDRFEEQNPGYSVSVRIKNSSGENSLLSSLALASAAAPNSVPSLVLINRMDMESAVEKSLVSPLSETAMDADADWYEYARNLGFFQGKLYGIPLAGDTLVLVYNSGLLTQEQINGVDSWNTLISLEKPVAFNSDDSQALLPLTIYLSAGGIVQDEDLQPALSIPVLTEVYRIFAQGTANGVFPAWVKDIQDDDDAWMRFKFGEADFLVTTISSYLANRSANYTALPLPALNTGNYALQDGWLWAVSDRDLDRRIMAEKLAEFLSSAEFMSEWSQAAGYLPVRPSAMVSWPTQSEKTLLGKAILSLQEMPSAAVISVLQVPIREGALKVIESGEDAFRAAEQAGKSLELEE